MIKNSVTARTSIIHWLTFWMSCLGVIALFALSLSMRVAQDTQGSAYSINQLGLLRMKSYQLLSQVPLSVSSLDQAKSFSQPLLTPENQAILSRYGLLDDLLALQQQWQNDIFVQLKQAQHINQVNEAVAVYVEKINALVNHIDQKTEQQIQKITHIQIFFIILILFFLVIQFCYLRHYILKPWKQLVLLAQAITQNHFGQRFQSKQARSSEFMLLGEAFNQMSDKIESQYQLLELRVNEKTALLQYKNDLMTFLYHAIKVLNTTLPLLDRFSIVLSEIETLVPLRDFRIDLYESDELEPLADRPLAIMQQKIGHEPETRRYWPLENGEHQYGAISANIVKPAVLTQEQEALLATLIEQMTVTVELTRKLDYQKSYLLMKERSAIARELHDSIAQSLSCLKIHVSCLQMQTDFVTPESELLLKTMRRDINIAYSQLRELITTFRLKVDRTGFYASLLELIKEFNQKLGFMIHLNYHLPLQIIDSQHAIHLLQIIREALNNIYKHAKASVVNVSLILQPDNIVNLVIEDNGIGLPDNWKKDEHYGLIIMQDRVDLLQGYFNVSSQFRQGTKITVTYKIQAEK
ncbi:histidine kinase [Utexia brackfieldae]|uniref:histidine kinase n=1 Tax=Utexia brackfieldae TaxID=3074108 RepID=UPI00370D7C29